MLLIKTQGERCDRGGASVCEVCPQTRPSTSTPLQLTYCLETPEKCTLTFNQPLPLRQTTQGPPLLL